MTSTRPEPRERGGDEAGAEAPGPEAFRPPWWLPGGHAQTVGGRLLRPRRPIRWGREVVETPEGMPVELDAAPGPADAPRVLLLHGLEGGSGSRYVTESARRLGRRGLRAVAMNFRPRSVPAPAPRTYHAGRTPEVAFAVRVLAGRSPGGRVAAVGFSLGANVLLKALAEAGAGARDRVAAAVAVSVPFDLSAVADRMDRRPGSLYGRLFLRSLRGATRRLAARYPDALDLAAAEAAGTIREFDDAVTAPLHGFRGAEHYYADSSSGPRLGGVEVPCLVLHARDDPLVPAASIPRDTIRRSACLVDGIQDHGGHVGFVDGPSPRRPGFWAEREAARFVAEHLTGGGGREAGRPRHEVRSKREARE